MIPALIGLGVSFVEKWAEAHFAKHAIKVPSATKQSTAIALIGDALNASNGHLPTGATAEALPSNLSDIIDAVVAVLNSGMLAKL